MPVWIRRAEQAPSSAARVPGSGRLDAAKWNTLVPIARPHRKVDRLAEAESVRDWGARPSGRRWRAASVINIQPITTYINPHSTSAGTAAAVQTRSYLLRSGSPVTAAGKPVFALVRRLV